MTIEEAKAVLTIPILWKRLDLRGEPKTLCRSPFRPDKHPSFSVSKDGLVFHDFATGEKGDAITFLAIATQQSLKDATRQFMGMAGGSAVTVRATVGFNADRRDAPKPEPQLRLKPSLPDFEHGTNAELHTLADLRKISFAACVIARGAGLLRFGKWEGEAAWFITDDEGLNAQARRLDGEPWAKIRAKAQTLPGSWGKWPVGLTTGRNYPTFLLVEGGPDLLAALHFIHLAGAETLFFPIATLGASMAIHEDALPLLAGKRIRIYAHTDPAGAKAAERWAAQLATVGAIVDCADFTGLRKADGSPVGDLNDCTSIHPEDAHELSNLLPL